MTLVDLVDFLPDVAPHVPGCPHQVMLGAVRQAAIELCKKSSVWVETLTAVNVVAGTSTYTLAAPDAQTVINDVLWVKHSGIPLDPVTEGQLEALDGEWETRTGEPMYYTMPTARSVRLAPEPTTAVTAGLTMRVSVRPAPDATQIEEILYEDFYLPIAAGALAQLMSMPDKEWTSKAGAEMYAGVFSAGVREAKTRAEQSNLATVVRQVRYGGIS